MFVSTPRFRTLILSGLAFAVSAPALTAQDETAEPPEGWVALTDGGHGGGDVEFVDMPPGMHITTGPAAIFYHPAKMASGEYTVESEVFLFDPGRRNEAFGIFIGGQDLEADTRAYTYFLIRRDGSVLVKRRDGADTSTLLGWTKNDAVLTWEDRGEEHAAKNVLGARVGGGQLTFSVNGVEVFSTSAEGQHVDGVAGFRVNHGLSLHFTSLEVTSG